VSKPADVFGVPRPRDAVDRVGSVQMTSSPIRSRRATMVPWPRRCPSPNVAAPVLPPAQCSDGRFRRSKIPQSARASGLAKPISCPGGPAENTPQLKDMRPGAGRRPTVRHESDISQPPDRHYSYRIENEGTDCTLPHTAGVEPPPGLVDRRGDVVTGRASSLGCGRWEKSDCPTVKQTPSRRRWRGSCQRVCPRWSTSDDPGFASRPSRVSGSGRFPPAATSCVSRPAASGRSATGSNNAAVGRDIRKPSSPV